MRVTSTVLSAFFLLLVLLGVYTVVKITFQDRQRHIGLLRCIGMTKGQTVLSLVVQGIILALCAAVLCAPLGVGFAWVAALVMRLSGYPFFTLVIELQPVLISCAVCAGPCSWRLYYSRLRFCAAASCPTARSQNRSARVPGHKSRPPLRGFGRAGEAAAYRISSPPCSLPAASRFCCSVRLPRSFLLCNYITGRDKTARNTAAITKSIWGKVTAFYLTLQLIPQRERRFRWQYRPAQADGGADGRQLRD